MNVLVSSAGRRGQLIQLIRETIGPWGGRVYAVDASDWSAACRLADEWRIVSRCDQPEFAIQLLDYCLAENVRVVIPTNDKELPILARMRENFAAEGIRIAVPGSDTIDITADKRATARFLADAGLPTVKLYPDQELDQEEIDFPVVIKPRFGSASSGVHVAYDEFEFQVFKRRVQEPIVQELATGQEYTINFFVDRNRVVRSAVPHRRVETRGGEVSKCVTVRQEQLISLARRIGERLPDAWGPMCYQAFVDDVGRIKIIEINARFGGGYPIAHRAGANFVQLLLNDALGLPLNSIDDWQIDLAMTRWDDAIFTTLSDAQDRVA